MRPEVAATLKTELAARCDSLQLSRNTDFNKDIDSKRYLMLGQVW